MGNNAIPEPAKRRPLFMLPTEGMTKKEMKAALKEALAQQGLLHTDEPEDESCK